MSESSEYQPFVPTYKQSKVARLVAFLFALIMTLVFVIGFVGALLLNASDTSDAEGIGYVGNAITFLIFALVFAVLALMFWTNFRSYRPPVKLVKIEMPKQISHVNVQSKRWEPSPDIWPPAELN